jgi:thiol-disulfide isomerase/thioredoxin
MNIRSGDNTGVRWQEGMLDQIFARARTESLPVFLFWGIDWCPDCAQVRDTILCQPEFVSRTRGLLAVYLDGDSESAQRMGQRLAVFDYPTLVLYAPDGRQITRFANDAPLDQFLAALDSALAVMVPVSDLLGPLRSAGRAQMTPDQCRMLACYDWQDDPLRASPTRDSMLAISAIEQACPPGMTDEGSRLYVEKLNLMLDSGPVTEAFQQQAAQRLIAILSDPGMRLCNLDLVINRPGITIARLSRAGSALHDTLETAWGLALDALDSEKRLPASTRMYITRARLRIIRANDAATALPSQLLEQTLSMAAWIDAHTTGHQRQAAMNAAINTLIEAGKLQIAIVMLEREINSSPSPSYLMDKLGKTVAMTGDKDTALRWRELAYQQSTGTASRFQWGVNLVLGLLDAAPDQDEHIRTTAVAIIGELGQSRDPLYNRNLKRLALLDSGLRQWNHKGDHTGSINEIRAALIGVCNNQSEHKEAANICTSFLATGDPAKGSRG